MHHIDVRFHMLKYYCLKIKISHREITKINSSIISSKGVQPFSRQCYIYYKWNISITFKTTGLILQFTSEERPHSPSPGNISSHLRRTSLQSAETCDERRNTTFHILLSYRHISRLLNALSALKKAKQPLVVSQVNYHCVHNWRQIKAVTKQNSQRQPNHT